MPQIITTRERRNQRNARRLIVVTGIVLIVASASALLIMGGAAALAAQKYGQVLKQDQQLQGRGQLGEDETLLENYIASKPPKQYQYPILVRLGDLAYGQGHYSQAAAWYVRTLSVRAQPDRHVITQLAMVSEQLGDRANAIKYWQQAIAATPANDITDSQQYQASIQRLGGAQ